MNLTTNNMKVQINKKTGQMSINIPKLISKQWDIKVGEEIDFWMPNEKDIYLTRIKFLPTCKDERHKAIMKQLKERLENLEL